MRLRQDQGARRRGIQRSHEQAQPDRGPDTRDKGNGERSAYCPDILVQSAAATAALNSFNRVLLANHIRTCVADDIRAGRDETIDELVNTLQKLMK